MTVILCYKVSRCFAFITLTVQISEPSSSTHTLYWPSVLELRHVWPCSTHTHTNLTALCPELPASACTRKVKPIWILLKQETVTGSGISWAICKSAPRSRQITIPAPHHWVFYRPDALPGAKPTVSKHWRQCLHCSTHYKKCFVLLIQSLWCNISRCVFECSWTLLVTITSHQRTSAIRWYRQTWNVRRLTRPVIGWQRLNDEMTGWRPSKLDLSSGFTAKRKTGTVSFV